MKKILLFLPAVFSIAGMLHAQTLQDATPSSEENGPSQRHVYLYEDFSNPETYFDTAHWDLATDTSYKALYYTAFSNAGGLPPEALWGYAPSSGMSRRMSGTYRLVSKPHAVPADARAYIAVRYDYYGNVASDSGVRSFGLSARKAGDADDWVSCRTVSITKSLAEPTRLVAELPAGYRGEEAVQVAVCFQTQIDKAYYWLYFDDIEFFSYPESHYGLAFAWRGRPYAREAQTLDLGLCVENTGNAMKSCKVSYTFDGGAPQTLSLTFGDTLMPGETYTLSGFKPAGWETAVKGHHAVEFWLSEADGVALSESAIVKTVKTLSLIDPETFPTYAYKPLVEEFSSSSCSSCKPRNETLKPVFEELGDRISVVKYQMYWPGKGDPYYTDEGGVRKFFYDIYNVPEIFLNGRRDPASGGAAGMKARFSEKINAAAWFNMAFDTLALDADTNIYVVFNVQSSVPMDGLRLHTVVLERQTEGNAGSNGETEFHHVALKMLPDGKGQPLSLEPDSVYTFRYAFDMKRTFMEEADDLKVVCFLQADNDSVMQSAIGDVKMRIATAPDLPVAVETTAWVSLPVYPNPASDNLYLKGLRAAMVEVFDMAGRRKYRQTGIDGDYVLDVRHYRPGFYLIRVTEGARVAYAKISVAR